MPHLILEYSNNLPEPVDFQALFRSLHAALAETGSVDPAILKSRAFAHDVFRVGAGAPEGVFVHLTVLLLSGRELASQQRIGERLLAVLRESLARTWAERPCDLTVEVREMRRETYFKAMNERARGAGGSG